MKKFWADFKKFISKGNIIDLAVAVVIGNAFNKIVSSLVNDVIMPLISVIIGGADVSEWKWIIKPAEYDSAGVQLVAETSLKYGVFIQTIIDFLIIALTIFIMVKVFTYSTKKLNEFGETIQAESKKIKKKLRKDKKGAYAEVIEEKTQEQTTQVEEKKEPIKTEGPKTETPSTESETVALLKEIRDALKPKKK